VLKTRCQAAAEVGPALGPGFSEASRESDVGYRGYQSFHKFVDWIALGSRFLQEKSLFMYEIAAKRLCFKVLQ